MSNSSFNSNYISVSGGSGGSNSTQDFRLTLASNTSVMTSEVLAATTLYLTPYIGNKIALYNGSTGWDVLGSSEVSISLSTIAADTNYDVFAYNNNGIVVLELLAWASSGAGNSTRATALVYQNGVLVKSGDTTRRYIGTIRGSASGQCQFSFGGGSSNGTEAKLFVWNYNNRVIVKANVWSTSDSWTSSSSWRAAKGSSTFRISFVQGVKEEPIDALYLVGVLSASVATNTQVGIGLNRTDGYDGWASLMQGDTGPWKTMQATLNDHTPIGYNWITPTELTISSGTATFLGYNNTAVAQYRYGFSAKMEM